MKVKITLEYEKEVDYNMPGKEVWCAYKHAEWVAEVVKALERLDYTHVHVMVEKVDEQEDENDIAKNN